MPMDKNRINKGLSLKSITLMKDISLLTISCQRLCYPYLILTVTVGVHLTHNKDKNML